MTDNSLTTLANDLAGLKAAALTDAGQIVNRC
jgi:hypothetical protein